MGCGVAGGGKSFVEISRGLGAHQQLIGSRNFQIYTKCGNDFSEP
jgi:hypothetical protein